MTQPPFACPVCDAPWQTCGPHWDGNPIDLPVAAARKEDPMDLDRYEVVINGMTTMAQLTSAQAARLGARKLAAVDEPAPKAKTKARQPANKNA